MQSRIAESVSARPEDVSVPAPPPEKVAAAEPLNGHTKHQLVEALRQSKIYQEYSQVFTHMTGLQVKLVPAIMGEPDGAGSPANPAVAGFIANSRFSPCFTLVPVNVKNRVVGYLQTGLMLNEKPEPEQFDEPESRGVAKRLLFSGSPAAKDTRIRH
jgi:hypothetical protein